MEDSNEGKARVGDRTKGNIHAPGNIEDNINHIWDDIFIDSSSYSIRDTDYR